MKSFFCSVICVVLFSTTSAQSQPSVELANKIADKMKDTLQLSLQQRQQVFAINLQLANQKKEVLRSYQNRDSIGHHLQRIETNRDSLYNPLLTPDQFLLYKSKKRVLVTAN